MGRCKLFACHWSARLTPFTTAFNSAKLMCQTLFAGRNQHTSFNTAPSFSNRTPNANELASTYTLIYSSLLHHSPQVGSSCVALSQHFLHSFGWGGHQFFDRLILRLLHPPCVLLPPLLHETSHTQAGASQVFCTRKNSLWEYQECLEPHFLVSITGCLPTPWCLGPVWVLCLQATLDTCIPGQTVFILLRCAMLDWHQDMPMLPFWSYPLVTTQHWRWPSCFVVWHSSQNPVWSDSTFCHKTPLSEMAITTGSISSASSLMMAHICSSNLLNRHCLDDCGHVQ